MISGHVGPDTMIWIAEHGKGQFYKVDSPNDLPQIFIKETAVILKSAIYEEPFTPQLRAASEVVRGIGANEYPKLLGYVATTPEAARRNPLVDGQGRPAAGALAIRPGPRRRLHLRRQSQMGQDLDELGASTGSSGPRSASGACAGWRMPISPPKSPSIRARASSTSRRWTSRATSATSSTSKPSSPAPKASAKPSASNKPARAITKRASRPKKSASTC